MGESRGLIGAGICERRDLRQRGYDTDWLSRDFKVGFCPIAYPEFSGANQRIIIPVY